MCLPGWNILQHEPSPPSGHGQGAGKADHSGRVALSKHGESQLNGDRCLIYNKKRCLNTKVTHTQNLIGDWISVVVGDTMGAFVPCSLKYISHSPVRGPQDCAQLPMEVHLLAFLSFWTHFLTALPEITFWINIVHTNPCLRLCFWRIQGMSVPNK